MDRREFLGSVIAGTVGSALPKQQKAKVADTYPPKWRNYTYSYTAVSNAEMVQRIRQARNVSRFIAPRQG